MDDIYHRQIFVKTIGLFLLTTFVACGPRSGVHNEVESDALPNPEIKIDTSSSKHKAADKFSEDYDKGHKLFKQNCAVCHYAHQEGRITGPGLKGFVDRIPKPTEEWFISYTLNCDSVFKSGDKYAKKLRAEYKGFEMTIFSGYLTTDDVKKIYHYLTTPPSQRGCVVY